MVIFCIQPRQCRHSAGWHCDIIVRNHASTPDEVTPIITGPATLPNRVYYDTGDQWFGIRLRPEHGAALWQDDLGNAPDSVLRGPEALHRLPSLAALHADALAFDALAHINLRETAYSAQFEPFFARRSAIITRLQSAGFLHVWHHHCFSRQT